MRTNPILTTAAPKLKLQESLDDTPSKRRSSKEDGPRDKSIPKFMRKSQINMLSRKKSEAKLDVQEPMRFISPKSDKKEFSNFFKSSKFEDVAHMFSSTITITSPRNSGMSSSDIYSQTHAPFGSMAMKQSVVIEDKDDREKDRMEIDRLREQLDEVKLKNEKLKIKVKEINNIQNFLLEREAYIFQLSQKNYTLKYENESLVQELNKATLNIDQMKQKQKKQEYDLLGQLQKIKSEIDKLNKEHEKELLNEIKQQKNQIDKLTKENSRLKEQLNIANKRKSISKDTAKQKISLCKKKTKQNKAIFSRAKAQGQIRKSRSVMFAASTCKKEENPSPKVMEIEECLSEIEYEQSENCDNNTLLQLCGNIDTIIESSHHKKNSFSKSEVGRDVHKALEATTDSDYLWTLVKELQQKNRYNEIEIDILKKMKMDTNKIVQQNEKLKVNNRKLLNKVDILTRKSAKRRSGSNQSLELSLSPKRH